MGSDDGANRRFHAVASLPAGNGGAAASVAVSWLDGQLRGDRQSADGSWVRSAGCAGTASGRWQRKQFPATASGHCPGGCHRAVRSARSMALAAESMLLMP